jgi:hypothetical protein
VEVEGWGVKESQLSDWKEEESKEAEMRKSREVE